MNKINLVKNGLSFLFCCFAISMFSQDADVELSAKEISNGIEIEWSISDDFLGEKVVLERSVHGTRFNALETYYDFQKALENQSSFKFIDSQMGMDKVAYRLRLQGEDHSYFSKIIEVNKKVVNTYRIAEQQLLPQGVFKVTIEAMDKNDLSLILIDKNGNRVHTEEWKTSLGLNDFYIDLDYFKDGTYSALIKKGKEYQSLTINKTTRKSDEVAVKNSNGKWKTPN